MRYEIVEEFPHEIMYSSGGLSISLYQPTHRRGPEKQQDQIVFKNQVQNIEKELLKEYSPLKVEDILKPLNELGMERTFWNRTKEGLALFMNEDQLIVYLIDRNLKEYSLVSDSFHIKPLIRVFQSADNYNVLQLDRKEVKFYRGNRYGLEELQFDDDTLIKSEDVLEEILGKEKLDKYVTHGAYGGVTGDGKSMYHGHGGKQTEVDKDRERYFRYIDKLILEEIYSEDSSPLVLVGLKENQAVFREISNNKYLLEEGIYKDYKKIDRRTLGEDTWEIVESIYLDKTKNITDNYHLEESKGLATGDLIDICRRAVEGRIDTLIIESDRIISGRIDRETGEIEASNSDLLNDLVSTVYQNKGHVVLLPKEKMMTNTGAAAIYRY